jgi:hypothetical protein
VDGQDDGRWPGVKGERPAQGIDSSSRQASGCGIVGQAARRASISANSWSADHRNVAAITSSLASKW